MKRDLADGHHSLFHAGFHLKRIFPKSSHSAQQHIALLDTFEEGLALRLQKLKPKVESDVCSLTWMKSAVESLAKTHSDIKSLINSLQLPVSDWDSEWINSYFEDSGKLLDVCVAFSSELAYLDHGVLFLQLASSTLNPTNGSRPIEQRVADACKALQDWAHQVKIRSPRLANSFPIIRGLATSLCPVKVKNSKKGKVLMRAMYGVKVHSVFTFSVFAALLSASDRLLMDLCVSEKFLWSKELEGLRDSVYQQVRNAASRRSDIMLKELEAVSMDVQTLLTVMGSDGRIESQDETVIGNPQLLRISVENRPFDDKKRDEIRHSAVGLEVSTERFAFALDGLTKEVKEFFQTVMEGRDVLLGNLRAPNNGQEEKRS